MKINSILQEQGKGGTKITPYYQPVKLNYTKNEQVEAVLTEKYLVSHLPPDFKLLCVPDSHIWSSNQNWFLICFNFMKFGAIFNTNFGKTGNSNLLYGLDDVRRFHK